MIQGQNTITAENNRTSPSNIFHSPQCYIMKYLHRQIRMEKITATNPIAVKIQTLHYRKFNLENLTI